ncbi:MAG: hypothetical protein ACC645_14130 [Pirellulales bacterium]
MKTTVCPLVVLLLFLSASSAFAERYERAPQGYAVVAEDDCGNFEAMPHLARGTEYVFSTSMVKSTVPYRDIVFDNDFCLFRYQGLNPQASYKVDVVYVTQAGGVRVQRLEANGHLVHGEMPLPVTTPGRFLFDIPREAYATGEPLDLKFLKTKGANAVVCYVRIWSTDPTPLADPTRLWTPAGPIEKDWARQDRLRGKPRFEAWQDPAKEIAENVVPCINELLERGRRILADLRRGDAADLDQSGAELAQVAAARDQLLAGQNPDPQTWLQLYLDAHWAVRRLAFKNPLLENGVLLFVRRHHPHAMHQCARRLGSFTLPGGGICILTDLQAEGQPRVRCVTEDKFPRGTFGRPDLSFDAKRIVFGFAPQREGERSEMSYGNISQQSALLYANHEAGPCHEFQCWEMGLDGENPAPRKLTFGPYENSDPLYLPGGRIAFMSHRPGGLVQCGDWALAYCVFTMNADGSDPRQITISKDGEWDPFLLEDGTIGFTRWDYVMKFWSPIQMLWSVRPDGTNARMIYGSDLGRKYAYPLNYASPRPIPGTNKLVCIGSAHHNTGAGPLCIIDLGIGPNVAEGMQRITPVRFVETPDRQPHNGWYDCPFPLDEKYFLVSYTFSQQETDTRNYAIYLLDLYGGKELIYRDEELSALFPILIQPRRRPRALAETAEGPKEGFGAFMIHDVHEGLAEAARGKARYVQVVEVHERHIHTAPYALEVGPDSGFETKTVLGTVPVEEDGSAYFRMPADTSVFFTVLDENHRALHTMRSVTSVRAGERTGCIGCHEPTRRAPSNRLTLASTKPPSRIQPPPWGVRPMDYDALVQPLLNQHCTACHDGTGGDGKSFDLTAGKERMFMNVPLVGSYTNLRKHVRHAPIFQYFLRPGTFGSRVSPLIDLLDKGHYQVELGRGEWQLLCAWIDCNAPYIGDYGVVAIETAANEPINGQALAVSDDDDRFFRPAGER